MILYLVEKGVHLDVADALPISDLEGWCTIYMNRDKEKYAMLAKLGMLK